MRGIFLYILAGVFFAGLAQAAEPDETIRKALKAVQPGIVVESIEPSPVPSLYQVNIGKGKVLYATADGKYIIEGNLFALQGTKTIDLTEKVRNKALARELNDIPVSEMIVYSPPKVVPTKTHITVFTDTNCFYCAKLHGDIPNLNKSGVEVRYLAYPIKGSYEDMVSVWCAPDRKLAMTKAMQKQGVVKATCQNPIDEQAQLAQSLGVSGTPSIFLVNGELVPGYQSDDELVKAAIQAQSEVK